MASLAWNTAARLHGDSGTSEGRCGLLPSDDQRWLMVGEPKSLQHKHMLPVCVQQIASGTYSCNTVFIFHFEHWRHFITHLSQYKLSQLLTLGASGTMITAGRQLSEYVG